MIHISFPKKENQPGTENTETGTRKDFPPEEQDINITEGGEFLDDAIRTHDQPLFAVSLDRTTNNPANNGD